MLQRVSSALEEVLPHVVVLGAERKGIECWPDVVPARGPLAGIATALSRMEHDRVVIVAVDQPFVRTATLVELTEFDSRIPIASS